MKEIKYSKKISMNEISNKILQKGRFVVQIIEIRPIIYIYAQKYVPYENCYNRKAPSWRDNVI